MGDEVQLDEVQLPLLQPFQKATQAWWFRTLSVTRTAGQSRTNLSSAASCPALVLLASELG